jgi:hypothetical protein
VTLNSATPVESISNDNDLEMPTTCFGARMTSMQVALIFDEQMIGRECLSQQCLNPGGTIGAHGKTRLKGFTVTLR